MTFRNPPTGRRRRVTALLAVAALALTGCSASLGGADTSGSSDVIKIGYVTPRTGALAAFGEADAYVLDQMTALFEEKGITTSDGVKHEVEIIAVDTQSDSKRASDVAADLILKDEVQLILVSSSPDTVNPVANQCEANQVVCISTVAPWQAFYFGRGATPEKGFDYTYHFFAGLEDIEPIYSGIWQAVTDSKNVGVLFPNDADGAAFGDEALGFPAYLKELDYTGNNPGAYPSGTTDFSAQIAAFKANNDEILLSIPIPPDFTTFWKQAAQQGYNPKVATIAKAMLFPSSVEALGKLGDNISTEVWWTPTFPFSSSLTGQSAAELASAFEESTGKQWTQPLGYSEALFEVADAVLSTSKSLESTDIASAVSTLKLDTVVGPLDWTSGPVPNVSTVPFVGGQWRIQPDGSYKLVIVYNKENPNIPLEGTPEPIDWSTNQ